MGENKHDHPQQENNHSQPNTTAHPSHTGADHSMHEMSDHSAHNAHAGHVMPASTKVSHEDHPVHVGHGVDHTGHEQMFRDRFWW